MSDLDYDALRKVAEAATPGPWTYDSGDGMVYAIQPDNDYIDIAAGQGTTICDPRHIATFDPPTVLRLLDLAQRAEAAEAAVERVRGLAEAWKQDGLGTDRLCATELLDTLNAKEDQ